MTQISQIEEPGEWQSPHVISSVSLTVLDLRYLRNLRMNISPLE
jgi:hypothetical protein